MNELSKNNQHRIKKGFTMSIVTQLSMLSWEEVENLGDLERLRLLIDHLPDEGLLTILQKKRSKGRDDYPVVAMWHAVLAGVVFQHASASSLVRELSRNAQLRFICGFKPFRSPSDDAMGRFLEKLVLHETDLREMAKELMNGIRNHLPDFGRYLAMDSKAISSLSPRASKEEKADGRRELDGEYGHKEYRGTHADGSAWSKVVKWFGFKLHLVVDATYELPVAWSVTKANVSDNTEGKDLVSEMMRDKEWLSGTAEYLMADKGYDDSALIRALDKTHHISPIIDKRSSWREKGTRLLENGKNVAYDEDGSVYCYEDDGKRHLMANGGYDAKRDVLKKLCPQKAKGVPCHCSKDCTVKSGFRIKRSFDERIFTPVDRTSHKWERLYNMRSSVERVNSRLDRGYGFEVHTIRGIKKMTMRCSLALLVMLGMAYGYLEEKKPEKIRKLVG